MEKIKYRWHDRNYDKELYETNEQEIKELLLYHKVKKVDEDSLILDNGVQLRIIGNEGCGGCNSGWYDLTELNDCDNAITDVKLTCECINPTSYYDEDYSYKIFVYAENKEILLAQIDGSDGNGFYGTGYTIYVKFPEGYVEPVDEFADLF